VEIPVDISCLAYWDKASKDFIVAEGEHLLQAGASSGDLRLKEKLLIRQQ